MHSMMVCITINYQIVITVVIEICGDRRESL